METEPEMSELGRFAAKTAIASFAFIVCAAFASSLATSMLTEVVRAPIRELQSVVYLHRFEVGAIDRVEALIQRLSETDMSEERQKRLLTSVRAASDKWRPFFIKAAAAMNGVDPPKVEARSPN